MICLTLILADSTNRKMTFEADTFTIQALASIDLPVISAFAGLGYNAGDSQFDVSGDYSIDYEIVGLPRFPEYLKTPSASPQKLQV